MKYISEFIKDENGTAAVEYSLLGAILGVSLIAAFTLLSEEVEAAFKEVGDAIYEATHNL